MKYRNKETGEILNAHRFNFPDFIGVEKGILGAFGVNTMNGVAHVEFPEGQKGIFENQYLVDYDNQKKRIVAKEEFENEYEPAHIIDKFLRESSYNEIYDYFKERGVDDGTFRVIMNMRSKL